PPQPSRRGTVAAARRLNESVPENLLGSMRSRFITHEEVPVLWCDILRQKTVGQSKRDAYFCQVRFLWRCARSFFRRLCLLILAFRRFFSEPIIRSSCPGRQHALPVSPPLAPALNSLRQLFHIVKRLTHPPSIHHLVQGVFDNSLSARRLQGG